MAQARRDPLRALRARLEAAELVHLREHALELHLQLEAARAEIAVLHQELRHVEDTAEMWRRTAEACDDVQLELHQDGAVTVRAVAGVH